MRFQVDTKGLEEMAERFGATRTQMSLALARALNHTGDKTRTRMARALTEQTGLKRKTIRKALRKSSAGASNPNYVVKSSGGDISVKYFGARETREGVTAAPWGKVTVYPGAFMTGGRKVRVPINKFNGHAYVRTGKSRFPIKRVKSGLFIPTEMITGASEAAFFTTSASEFPARIEHELNRILGSD